MSPSNKDKTLKLLILSSFRAINLDTGEELVVITNKDFPIIGKQVYANFKETAEKLVIKDYVEIP